MFRSLLSLVLLFVEKIERGMKVLSLGERKKRKVIERNFSSLRWRKKGKMMGTNFLLL